MFLRVPIVNAIATDQCRGKNETSGYQCSQEALDGRYSCERHTTRVAPGARTVWVEGPQGFIRTPPFPEGENR